MEIYPSIISSDILNLESVINLIEPESDGLHLDVMDNHFVPNLTFGHMFINEIINKTKLPVCVHLMVSNPETFLDRLRLRDIDTFIFHMEAIDDIIGLVNKVRGKGYKVGIAIKPSTSIVEVKQYLNDIDELLLMSVEPGFSGQKFMPEVLDKVKDINRDSLIISMDGGINEGNIKQVKNSGVHRVVVASAIFFGSDPLSSLKSLRGLSE